MTLKSVELEVDFFSLFIEKWNLVLRRKKFLRIEIRSCCRFYFLLLKKATQGTKKMNFCVGQTKRLADSMNGENIEAGFNTTTKTFQILTPIAALRSQMAWLGLFFLSTIFPLSPYAAARVWTHVLLPVSLSVQSKLFARIFWLSQ